jgi:hypothetical protein
MAFASLAIVAVLVCMAPAANANPAKVGVIAPSSITAVLHGSGATQTATIHLVVTNTGDTATDVSVSGVVDDATIPGCHTNALTASITPTSVSAHSSVPSVVTLEAERSCSGRTGTLLVTGPGLDAASAHFTLARTLSATKVALPAIVAVILTLIALIVLFALPGKRSIFTLEGAALGPAWTLSSWLTNTAVVAGLLGTVIAQSGVLGDMVPGLVTAPFAGLSLVFTLVVTGAPIVYYALSRQVADPKQPGTSATAGSAIGLTAVMVLDLFGVFGELATIALIIHESNRPGLQTTAQFLGVAIAAIAAGVYAVRSTHDIIELDTTPPPPPSAAAVGKQPRRVTTPKGGIPRLAGAAL